MRKIIIFAFALLAVVLLAHNLRAPGGGGGEEQTGDLSGKIYTPATYCPAALSDIYLNMGFGDVFVDNTDCNAMYLDTGVPVGASYVLTSRKSGYDPKSKTINIVAGGNTAGSMVLPSITGASYPTCFNAVVKDALTSAPLDNVVVTYTSQAGNIVTSITGDDSIFTVPWPQWPSETNPCYVCIYRDFAISTFRFDKGCANLGPATNGTYKLTVTKSGYVPKIVTYTLGDCSQRMDVSLTRVVDCGLRVRGSAGTIKIACEPFGSLTSPLRVAKSSSVVYGIALVDPADPSASSARITLGNGQTKALMKLP